MYKEQKLIKTQLLTHTLLENTNLLQQETLKQAGSEIPRSPNK